MCDDAPAVVWKDAAGECVYWLLGVCTCACTEEEVWFCVALGLIPPEVGTTEEEALDWVRVVVEVSPRLGLGERARSACVP